MANPVKARNDYARRHYDRLQMQFPAGSLPGLRAAAAAAGAPSLTAWIAALLERETGMELVLRGEFGPRKPRKPAEDAADGDGK